MRKLDQFIVNLAIKMRRHVYKKNTNHLSFTCKIYFYVFPTRKKIGTKRFKTVYSNIVPCYIVLVSLSHCGSDRFREVLLGFSESGLSEKFERNTFNFFHNSFFQSNSNDCIRKITSKSISQYPVFIQKRCNLIKKKDYF